MTFAGKTVVVTGAGGGFGEGIAKRFAALGAQVVAVDVRAGEAERVAGRASVYKWAVLVLGEEFGAVGGGEGDWGAGRAV